MKLPQQLRPRPPQRAPWLLVVCLGVVGCSSYNSKTSGAFKAFQGGRFQEAEKRFADTDVTDSKFLSGVEAGTVALTAGNWGAAVDHFAKAVEEVEEGERQGLLDPGGLGRGLASLAINEGAKAYRGEGYERALLHASLGLAYLAQGQLGDLFVEVQLAGDLLAAEEKLYETDYRAGGLAHLVSAIAYELRGEPDQAYIDWLALEEKGLALPLAGPSLVRLARRLNREDDLARWLEAYGEPAALPEGAAQVVLIAGVGLGPSKREARLDLPTGNGLLSWAIPRYEQRSQAIGGLELRAGELAASTVVVEDVGRVAEKNLEDRIALLTARSTGRAFAKRELTRTLEKEHGVAGALVGNIFSFLTERADLRTWSTLPDSYQAARILLPPGPTNISVAAGVNAEDLGFFELTPGETVFLLARTLGGRIYVHVIGGARVAGADRLPSETP